MKLHLLMIANTDDESIGDNVQIDVENVTGWLEEACQCIGLPLGTTVITGEYFTKENVKEAVRNMSPDPDDTVFFWYSGHGFRTPSKKEQWPYIHIPNDPSGLPDGLDEKWVYDNLKAKNTRLLLVCCDCCNSVANIEVEDDMAFRSATDQKRVELNYRRLLVESRGSLLAASSQPGEYSFCSQNGGVFTCAFLKSVRHMVLDENTSWESIMARASIPVPQSGNETGYQTPIYELEMGGKTTRQKSARVGSKPASTSGKQAKVARPQTLAKGIKPTHRFLKTFSYANWDKSVTGIKEWLDWVKKASPEELGDEVGALSRSKLWKHVPDGNRNYMETALLARHKTPDAAQGYIEGLRPHLHNAWPHIMAAIFSHSPDKQSDADDISKALAALNANIRKAPPRQLAEFLAGISKDRNAKKAVLPGNMKTIQTWLTSYEKNQKEDSGKGNLYIEEKRTGIENLLSKVVFPAMIRHMGKH